MPDPNETANQPLAETDDSAAISPEEESTQAVAPDETPAGDVLDGQTGEVAETGEDTGDLDFGEAPPEGTPERTNWDNWRAKLTANAQVVAARKRELDAREQALAQREQGGGGEAAPTGDKPDAAAAFDRFIREAYEVDPEYLDDFQRRQAWIEYQRLQQTITQTQQARRDAFRARFEDVLAANPGLTRQVIVQQLDALATRLRITEEQATPDLVDLAVLELKTAGSDQRKRQRAAEVKASTATLRGSGTGQVPEGGGKTMREIVIEEARREGRDPGLD